MTIRAVFEADGIKYEEVFISKKRFLSSISRRKDLFLHAVDIERGIIVYPSNLPEYRGIA
jgi:hypothetical protein